MRFMRIIGLFLILAVPCAKAQQSNKPRPTSRTPTSQQPQPKELPSPPQLSREKAFYYFVAIYGAPPDVIDRYGKTFDASNYDRAMADEFERRRYRNQIETRVKDGVSRVDFSEKFTFLVHARLGEYSFNSNSFPFVGGSFQTFSFCVGPSNYLRANCLPLEEVTFSLQSAVNGNDFAWSVPMSETDANAFVKSRAIVGSGEVDRGIVIRIICSIVNKKASMTFSPFLYSIEAYGDKTLSQKLGVVPMKNSLGPRTAEEWSLAMLAAQTATREIGKYRYIAASDSKKPSTKLENPLRRSTVTPLFGTITLTDVGIVLSGERPEDNSERQSVSYFDSLSSSYATTLWRANFGWAKDFRVVWQPFWNVDHSSALRFESLQERDRFFEDLTRAIQEWKIKYAPFQFAAGKLAIEQRCEYNTRFIPCSTNAPFGESQDSPKPASAASNIDDNVPSANAPTGSDRSSVGGLTTIATGARNLEALGAALDRGENITFKIKYYRSSWTEPPRMEDGLLMMSKTAISYQPAAGDKGFSVSPDKILEVINEQPIRVRLKVAIKNTKGDKEDKKEFQLFHPTAFLNGLRFYCNECDGSMGVLFGFLQHLRGKL